MKQSRHSRLSGGAGRIVRLSIKADSRLAPSQRKTSLQNNTVSHWMGANLESALSMYLFSYIAQFFCALLCENEKKNDNFMCLLEFECAKRLKAHSQAIPDGYMVVMYSSSGQTRKFDF